MVSPILARESWSGIGGEVVRFKTARSTLDISKHSIQSTTANHVDNRITSSVNHPVLTPHIRHIRRYQCALIINLTRSHRTNTKTQPRRPPEFYNLKPSELDPNSSKEALPTEDAPPTSELDNPSFDAASYVKNLLAHEGLEGVLRVEAGLLADIRGFDGERKALVYDNYSKLIAATDTIRKMRSNICLLYTSPSPRDRTRSRMPSSA